MCKNEDYIGHVSSTWKTDGISTDGSGMTDLNERKRLQLLVDQAIKACEKVKEIDDLAYCGLVDYLYHDGLERK